MQFHPSLRDWFRCSCGFSRDIYGFHAMKITIEELNSHKYPTTPEIDANLNILLERINRVRDAFNKPMIITSGLRSQEQQQALIASGKSNAPHSKHLNGEACDVDDPNGELKSWVMANLSIIENIGLWMEDFNHCSNWIHFQIVAPNSGNRFFIP